MYRRVKGPKHDTTKLKSSKCTGGCKDHRVTYLKGGIHSLTECVKTTARHELTEVIKMYRRGKDQNMTQLN